VETVIVSVDLPGCAGMHEIELDMAARLLKVRSVEQGLGWGSY
jgi:hypothetical protein